MTSKQLQGVSGFSAYSLGAGCRLLIETVDGKQYEFALSRALVEAMIVQLQKPSIDPTEQKR